MKILVSCCFRTRIIMKECGFGSRSNCSQEWVPKVLNIKIGLDYVMCNQLCTMLRGVHSAKLVANSYFVVVFVSRFVYVWIIVRK
jgi:hypothetical protein